MVIWPNLLMMHDWSTGDYGGQVPGSAERLHLAVLGQDPHCWTSAVSALHSHCLCYTIDFSLFVFGIQCISVSLSLLCNWFQSHCLWYTVHFSCIIFVIQCISVTFSPSLYSAFQSHTLCYAVHFSHIIFWLYSRFQSHSACYTVDVSLILCYRVHFSLILLGIQWITFHSLLGLYSGFQSHSVVYTVP